MTDAELASINDIRRRKGLPPLSKFQAREAVTSHPSQRDPGFDTTGFLIGYMTGIPISGAGLVGAMLHDSGGHQSSPSSDDSFSSGGGTYSGAGASSSWDSSSSSSSSDSSSSSSSYDSGSSSSSSSGDGS